MLIFYKESSSSTTQGLKCSEQQGQKEKKDLAMENPVYNVKNKVIFQPKQITAPQSAQKHN